MSQSYYDERCKFGSAIPTLGSLIKFLGGCPFQCDPSTLKLILSFKMQLMRRRLGDRSVWNLVARSWSYNLNFASGHCAIATYESVEGEKLLLHCALKSSEVAGSSNGVLESVWGHIEKTFPPRDDTNIVKNAEHLAHVHLLDRGHVVLCGLSLEDDELSIARSTRAAANKLVRNGATSAEVFGKLLRKADSREEFRPFGVDWTGRARSLHTEVEGEKHGDATSEEVTTLRRVKSTVKEKALREKTGRTARKVASTTISRRRTAVLQPPSYEPVREKERDGFPTICGESGSEALKDGDEEVATVAQDVPAELHDDDHEETGKKPFLARGQIVQQRLPSESRYDAQNSTGTEEDDMERRSAAQAMALLRAALDEADEEDGKVDEEFQRSLRVGIVGAPNAGKSLLTNQLVGTRVSAVSRKTNTTHREHLGVFTKDDTQLLYYDTPGLHLDIEGSPLRVDAQHRVRNAWEIVDFCEALVVLVDAERQIRRPDKRVQRLVEKLGREEMVSQKRVLCLNKVDLIEQKRLLLPLAKQFEDLLGYDRIFMISGLTGSGVKDVRDYLVNQAVLRPWDEDPEQKDHRDIALEVVREQVFEHLHEELPHTTQQKLVSWKVLKDGSIRIQQLLLVAKKEHQKILVGKNGAVIGEIGVKARKELQEILGVTVHLVLDVKPMTGKMIGDG